MKPCGKCDREIDDKYEFCYEHYSPRKTDMAAKAPGAWHDDPLVDQLMKMNSNLGKIAQALGELVRK